MARSSRRAPDCALLAPALAARCGLPAVATGDVHMHRRSRRRLQDLLTATAPPLQEPGHYLGTDSLGRDVLSRLIYASRIALTVAFVARLMAGFLATTAR